MSKKVKVIISALVVALLLTVGGVTMVTADEEPDEEPTLPALEADAGGLLERVADILEIDKEDLINAFKQAQQEMRQDTFISHINQAAEEGLITQEQANEIIKWWEQRPDDEIREWWGQKPDALEPGMFKQNLRSRISPRFHIQNRLGEGFCW